MPLSPPPVTDERDGLMVFWNQQRDGVRAAVLNISEEQARAKLVPTSELCLAALLKHVTAVEREWVQIAQGNAAAFEPDPSRGGWVLEPGDTVEALLADYRRAQAESEPIFAGLDLDAPVPAPEAPWFPDGLAWSVRWVLLHLIEETARHAGHADLLREAVDGKGMYEVLMESGL